MKTWFITGISRGLGLALAEAALARGDTVFGTVRDSAPEVPNQGGRLHVLRGDLADGEIAERLLREAFATAGSIDVLVNNAGYGLLGALETATDEEMRRLFAVDVFAPIRIIRAALPHLRQQRSGHIINVTSIAGRAPTIGAALYSAAKHALEGLSASLSLEVASLGIKVTAVAPGAFRTDFLSDHSIRRSTREDAAYAETIGRSAAHFQTLHGQQAGDPKRAAAAIITVVDSPNPPLHLLLGSDALRRAREKLAAVTAEIEAWESVTRGTDFEKQG